MPALGRTLLLLAICIAGAAGLSILLFPRDHELALMSFRDADYDKARRYYETRLAAGDISIPILMPLIEIYTQSGQTDRAAEVLERFVRQNPANVEALTLLVQLCKDAVLPGKYRYYLAALLAIAPTKERSEDLANLYGFKEQYDKQIAVLQEQLGRGEGSAQDSLLVPLLASAGRQAAAVETGLELDHGDPRHLDADARYILFRLLIDMERVEEAYQLAERWVGEASDASAGLVLFGEWFLYKGYPHLALRLVGGHEQELYGDVQDLRSVYVTALKATKNYSRLRSFWTQRLAAVNLSDREEVFILYSLLDIGDYRQALPLLRKRAGANRGDWLFAYVETAVKAGQEQDLMDFLETEFSRPGAAVADSQSLASIVLQKSPRSLVSFLRSYAERDPQSWAYLYVEALERSRRRSELFAYMEHILAAGKLDRAARDQWLHRLIAEGGLARALPHIQRVAVSDGGDWRGIYVTALRQLQRKDELRRYLASTLQDGNLQAAERRWIAEELLREGMKKEALRVFTELADGVPPDAPEVRSLVFLWGPKPQASELAWVERKLPDANDADREGWLRLLLELGASDRVASWFEGPGQSRDVAYRYLYVDALAASAQPKKLVREIALATGAEKDAAKLARYAQLAVTAGDLAVADRAWAALQQIAPDDETAHRQRGLLLLSLRRFAESEADLRAYLRRSEVDYEAQYAYAEVLLVLGRREDAEQHYQRALSQISFSSGKKYQARVIEAMCLHRLGEKSKAIAAFRELLQDYPDNRNLRSDFASMLLENNSMEMAKYVLDLQ